MVFIYSRKKKVPGRCVSNKYSSTVHVLQCTTELLKMNFFIGMEIEVALIDAWNKINKLLYFCHLFSKKETVWTEKKVAL